MQITRKHAPVRLIAEQRNWRHRDSRRTPRVTLIRIVSNGLRTDDFNCRLKENVDSKINSLKNNCEGVSEIERTLKITDLEFNH